MYTKIACVALVAVGCFVDGQAVAGNWSHWRGDGGNGTASTATPPTSWSETKNVRWKTVVPGRGSGSPIVWENQVFVVSAIDPAGDDVGTRVRPLQFTLLSFDRDTGGRLWQQTAVDAKPHEGAHRTNSFASASPCTDGERVYAHFGSRGLFCYGMDGQSLWKRDMGKMTTRSTFGEGSSPTLVGDKLIVPWDHEGQSYLFALNKVTGETVWQAPRDEPSCWATPLAIEHNQRTQIVMSGQNFARAYDLETGQELWRCAGQTERPVASAVAADGLLFIGSGFRGSFLGAFRPDGSGDIQGSRSVVWTVNRNTPDIASPLLSDGRLYFHKGKSGLLSCLDAATGKPHYTTQRTGLGTIYSSPIAAAGYVFLTDRNGKTIVIKDADQFEVVSTNNLGETIDATLAPVDDELFIRGERHLFCISSQ